MPGKSSASCIEDEAHIVARSSARILETIAQALDAVGESDWRNSWSGGWVR